jgi:hypothetical protein
MVVVVISIYRQQDTWGPGECTRLPSKLFFYTLTSGQKYQRTCPSLNSGSTLPLAPSPVSLRSYPWVVKLSKYTKFKVFMKVQSLWSTNI